MNNCYLGHKEAIKNLESDILKSGYKPVPLKNRYNLEAFTKHNKLVSVEAAKIRKVVDLWDSSLARLGIKGSVVKSIVKDNLADGDSSVPFARRVIDIEYNEDVLEKLDDFRKSLGIYDSKLSYASYLDAKRAEQSLEKDVDVNEDAQLKKQEEKSKEIDESETRTYEKNSTDPAIRSKYFKDGNTTTGKKIVESIAFSNHPLNILAKHLLPYLHNISVELLPREFTEEREITYADGRKEVIRPAGNALQNSIRIAEFASFRGVGSEPTILHEILHSLSLRVLRDANNQKTKDFTKLYKEALEKNPAISNIYAGKDIDEFFVGLFTDSELIVLLKNIPSNLDVKYDNLFEYFFAKILSWFKITKENSTLYSKAVALGSNIVKENYEKAIIEEKNLEDFEAYSNEYWESRFNEEDELPFQNIPSTQTIKPGVEELFNENFLIFTKAKDVEEVITKLINNNVIEKKCS
jgi:hypothetical protein